MMFVRQPIGEAHGRLWLETWTSAGRHWAGASQGGSGSVQETGRPSTRGRALVSAQLREHVQLGDQGRPGPVTSGPLEGGMAVRLGPAELARPAFPVWMGPRVLNRKEVGGQVLWTGWNLPFPSQCLRPDPELHMFLCSSLLRLMRRNGVSGVTGLWPFPSILTI